MQELRKARPELRSLEKSGEERSFSLAHCLDEVARAEEGGLTGGGDTGVRVRAAVGAGAELVMS